MPMATLPPEDKDFGLPIWGRVIDEREAMYVKRDCLLPLLPREVTEGESLAPPLYLDGSSFLNIHKSDCCFAWYVGLTKVEKKQIVSYLHSLEHPDEYEEGEGGEGDGEKPKEKAEEYWVKHGFT